MGIINRDLANGQNRDTYSEVLNATPSGVSAGILNPGLSTGFTFPVMTVPYPGSLAAANCVAWGTSGSPVHSLWVYRFAGGFTAFAIGQTLAITAFGTSGAQNFTLIAGSAATLPLLASDQIVLYTQGANSAVALTTVTLAIQALQDFKTHFGV